MPKNKNKNLVKRIDKNSKWDIMQTKFRINGGQYDKYITY